ncbi:MAG: 3-keto-5-aminohexanoate cleavage protein [Deltaproteobacteria bacterium]|nr:3-keto-5-aminohexanoate cleavage protein [Deltaproteobacteria bacterium]
MSTDQLIITCAITGAEISKKDFPALPVTPAEQAQAAKEAVAAGASIIHLHVRDDQGKPSQALADFKNAVDAIKAAVPDVIMQFSTGGAVGESLQNRLAPLSLQPEMASLNMGSMNFGEELFQNLPSDIRAFAAEMQKQSILPELEVYDAGMLEYAAKLVQQNVLQLPVHIQFVLGVPGGMSGELKNLVFLLDRAHDLFAADFHWGVAGIGRYQLPMATHAINSGGHVRVGLEDNIYFRKGEKAKSNAQLVERVVQIANECERKVATVAQTRQLLGL